MMCLFFADRSPKPHTCTVRHNIFFNELLTLGFENGLLAFMIYFNVNGCTNMLFSGSSEKWQFWRYEEGTDIRHTYCILYVYFWIIGLISFPPNTTQLNTTFLMDEFTSGVNCNLSPFLESRVQFHCSHPGPMTKTFVKNHFAPTTWLKTVEASKPAVPRDRFRRRIVKFSWKNVYFE